MFCDHSFCEAPFASFISIEINGEIFYYDLSIEQSISLDLSIDSSLEFDLEITQQNNQVLVR